MGATLVEIVWMALKRLALNRYICEQKRVLQSPIYNAFDNETENWINRENNGIWPKEFISVKSETTSFINYCPQHILRQVYNLVL